MKIACIGNMNNMLFSLTRYIRDRGYDCDLFLFNNEQEHFFPHHDTYDFDYKGYVKELKWGDVNSWKSTDPNSIRKEFESYDFLIGTHLAPAFLKKAGLKLDVFFPHGTDIYHFPFIPDTLSYYHKWRSRDLVELYRYHKAGIKEAICINQYPDNDLYMNAIKKLGIEDRVYYFGCPMVYSKIYNPETIKENYKASSWYPSFKKIREQADLLILYHARQLWKSHDVLNQESKRSDVLIRAFKKFVSENHKKAKLILLEYGQDVEYSKLLVRELGLENDVFWIPKMSRSEIMVAVSLVDIGCGEFWPGCIGGGTAWEVLTMGKPLMQYVDFNKADFKYFTEPYPFLNVYSEEDFIKEFEGFFGDKDNYIKLGKSGQEWFKKNFEQGSVDAWVELIEMKRTNNNLVDFVKSKSIINN